jgi:hypothetical protein
VPTGLIHLLQTNIERNGEFKLSLEELVFPKPCFLSVCRRHSIGCCGYGRIMNWKGFERKSFVDYMKYHSSSRLERLKTPSRSLCQNLGVLSDVKSEQNSKMFSFVLNFVRSLPAK